MKHRLNRHPLKNVLLQLGGESRTAGRWKAGAASLHHHPLPRGDVWPPPALPKHPSGARLSLSKPGREGALRNPRAMAREGRGGDSGALRPSLPLLAAVLLL